ncbi:MAG: DUF3943 domain-containing protein [Vibrio sp.]
MLKKNITPMMLLTFSACVNAQQDVNLQSDFAYQLGCEQSNCYSSNYYTDSLNPAFSLSINDASTLRLDDPLPKYLLVQDSRDWDYLTGQTYTILGLSVMTAGLMTLLPESITKWDADDRKLSNLGKKWKENVTSGPTWDRDEHFLNYIMHPYFGGVYYTAARHAGFNEFESFLYSATMSTFFWEYGVESFAEVPSWQDIFITPFFGAVVGELMFDAEQNIVANGGQVMGSNAAGDVTLFFLNPIGHIHGWVSDAWGGSADVSFQSNPWANNPEAAKYAMDAGANYDSQYYGLNVKITF